MREKILRTTSLLRYLAFAIGFSTAPMFAATINVFAAASLSEVLKEIASAYERQTGDKVVFNFGASSTLARQIEEGAPADIFFSADEAKMNALDAKGLIVKDTRKSRLSNSLVVVIAADSPLPIHSASDLAKADVRRIALADPKTVPAGIYAREYLEQAKLWSAVEKKVVPVDNVRAALSAVESGNVDAGIVYRTDARISKKVKVAYEVPAREGPAISYPMAVLKVTEKAAVARRFLDYLESDQAGRVFEKAGFIVRQ